MSGALHETVTQTLDEVRKAKVKQELTKEEKQERSKQSYLLLIERCRNQEYQTLAERRAVHTPEDKKEALATRRRLSNQKYRAQHKEEWNAYTRIRMRDRYRNDDVFRIKQLETATLKRAFKKAAANEASNLDALTIND
jgi:hypothetical protein